MDNLLYQMLKVRIGNSFFRSFYPHEYRLTQSSLKSISSTDKEDSARIRSIANLTNGVQKKLGSVLQMLRQEIDDMYSAMDSMQASITAGQQAIIDSNKDLSESLLSLSDLVVGGYIAKKAYQRLKERRARKAKARAAKERARLEAEARARGETVPDATLKTEGTGPRGPELETKTTPKIRGRGLVGALAGLAVAGAATYGMSKLGEGVTEEYQSQQPEPPRDLPAPPSPPSFQTYQVPGQSGMPPPPPDLAPTQSVPDDAASYGAGEAATAARSNALAAATNMVQSSQPASGMGSPRGVTIPPPTGGVVGTARQYLGKSEGANRDELNAFVGQFFNIDVRRTPWCAAFTNSVLESNGIRGTGSLAAFSFANYGAPVWSATEGGDVSNIQPGDIAVFKSSHVAFVEGAAGDSIQVIGGNQSDRTGGGGAVTQRSRNLKDVLAVVRPVAMAAGAKVTKPTLALIGEAGEPEYVVPQRKVKEFAHEMMASAPITKTKRHTHLVLMPIIT